jgi:hypothetical protein
MQLPRHLSFNRIFMTLSGSIVVMAAIAVGVAIAWPLLAPGTTSFEGVPDTKSLRIAYRRFNRELCTTTGRHRRLC